MRKLTAEQTAKLAADLYNRLSKSRPSGLDIDRQHADLAAAIQLLLRKRSEVTVVKFGSTNMLVFRDDFAGSTTTELRDRLTDAGRFANPDEDLVAAAGKPLSAKDLL
jgi:hypothetical protein